MAQYSIKDIELLTGIKAHTLRIWEQRYNIPSPKRTETNIRYYDDADLKLLLNISLLNHNGHKISRITSLPALEISKLAVSYSLDADNHPAALRMMIAATTELDEQALNNIILKSFNHIGVEKTMMEVIFPFLEVVGVLWQSGTINPAYEHFVSSIIRNKLIFATEKADPPKRKDKKFLLFLPEREWHEIGLLFANYMIRASGNQSLFLGQNVPLEDLSVLAGQFKPDYIFTSVTCAQTAEFIEVFFKTLKKIFQKQLCFSQGNTLRHYRSGMQALSLSL